MILLIGSTNGVGEGTQTVTSNKPKFRVLALAEPGGHHIAFTKPAKPWLNRCAQDEGFEIDVITSVEDVTASLLAKYKVILQLDFVPYGWKPEAMAAFKSFVEEGKGGWVGLHH